MSSVGFESGEQVDSHVPPSPLCLPALRPYVFALLLIVLTVGLYWPVRTHPFVNYDDDVYVTGNPHVQNGLLRTRSLGRSSPVTPEIGTQSTWLSHAFDSQVYDQDPAGHHQTSMLIHAIGTRACFSGCFGAPPDTQAAALLWLPYSRSIPSMSNRWHLISERKTLLSMMFFCSR